MIKANHPFNKRQLNVLVDGIEGCATCGRPRSVHPDALADALAERRADPVFMQRIRRRVREDRQLLDLLESEDAL